MPGDGGMSAGPDGGSRYDTRSPALAVLVEVGLAERLTHPLSQ